MCFIITVKIDAYPNTTEVEQGTTVVLVCRVVGVPYGSVLPPWTMLWWFWWIVTSTSTSTCPVISQFTSIRYSNHSTHQNDCCSLLHFRYVWIGIDLNCNINCKAHTIRYSTTLWNTNAIGYSTVAVICDIFSNAYSVVVLLTLYVAWSGRANLTS